MTPRSALVVLVTTSEDGTTLHSTVWAIPPEGAEPFRAAATDLLGAPRYESVGSHDDMRAARDAARRLGLMPVEMFNPPQEGPTPQ